MVAAKSKRVENGVAEQNKKIKEEPVDVSLPKVVIGLDFGTTHSGFAFAHRSNPDDVHVFSEWPNAPRAYCKGQTSLFYVPEAGKGRFRLEDWSWNATSKFVKACKAFRLEWAKNHVEPPPPGELDKAGVLATNFKLLLAEEGGKAPDGLPVEVLVVDYLRSIYQFISYHLKDKYGKGFSTREVQWCLTVPAIWSDGAKQKMQVFLEKAELVRGSFCNSWEASIYPLRIILEPEAASFCCQRQLQGVVSFSRKDKFLVADLGGGTIDIIVHEKENAVDKVHKVHEVSANTGALGGGTYVDSNFLAFLGEKIECFEAFRLQEPDVVQRILDWWLGPQGKATFDGTGSKFLEVPHKLSNAWKRHDQMKQLGFSESNDDYYGEIEMSSEKMCAFFDTEINKAIKLIQEKLCGAHGIKYIFLVGGLSENPYVVKKIKERCSCAVKDVLAPPNPGAAICRGAVALGAGTGVVLSRISKAWYGIFKSRDSHVDDPPELLYFDKRGNSKCGKVFSLYVKKGESVSENKFVAQRFGPVNEDDTVMIISLVCSSNDVQPKYTNIGCSLLGQHGFNINEDLHLGVNRSVEVTMCFGKSCIEVFARRVNFGSKREPEKLYYVDFNAASHIANK